MMITPRANLEASVSRMNCLVQSGVCNTGYDAQMAFKLLKDSSSSLPQDYCRTFLVRLLRGHAMWENLGMKAL